MGADLGLAFTWRDWSPLYTEREHGLPPGRTVALRPVMGARSVLLLEGDEHLARRRLMLPPFHGERMQAYESVVREHLEIRVMDSPSASYLTLWVVSRVDRHFFHGSVAGAENWPIETNPQRGLPGVKSALK